MVDPTGKLSGTGAPRADDDTALGAAPLPARLELVPTGHQAPATTGPLEEPTVSELPSTRRGSRSGAPTHRRRSRWFELNPGCVGRAALWGGGAALGGAALGGLGLWAAWRLWRTLGIVGTARAMWRAYRRVRRLRRARHMRHVRHVRRVVTGES